MGILKALWKVVVWFFSATADSIRKTVNLSDLVRIAIAVIAAGGGINELLAQVQANWGTIWLNPTTSGLALGIAVGIFEFIRRYLHGSDVVPVPAK